MCCVAARSAFERRSCVLPTVTTMRRRPGTSTTVFVRRGPCLARIGRVTPAERARVQSPGGRPVSCCRQTVRPNDTPVRQVWWAARLEGPVGPFRITLQAAGQRPGRPPWRGGWPNSRRTNRRLSPGLWADVAPLLKKANTPSLAALGEQLPEARQALPKDSPPRAGLRADRPGTPDAEHMYRGRTAPPRVPGHPGDDAARCLVQLQHEGAARRRAPGPEEVRRRRAAAPGRRRGAQAAGEDDPAAGPEPPA